jgi:osmotically-inducible protein OsmY
MNSVARRIVAALALTVPVIGCAQTMTSESTGQSDATITTNVQTAIMQDPVLKVMQIEVQTNKSTVQLSGFVATPEMIVRAGEIARHASGVSAVQNNLMVK